MLLESMRFHNSDHATPAPKDGVTLTRTTTSTHKSLLYMHNKTQKPRYSPILGRSHEEHVHITDPPRTRFWLLLDFPLGQTDEPTLEFHGQSPHKVPRQMPIYSHVLATST
jgi:hypothetical protein